MILIKTGIFRRAGWSNKKKHSREGYQCFLEQQNKHLYCVVPKAMHSPFAGISRIDSLPTPHET